MLDKLGVYETCLNKEDMRFTNMSNSYRNTIFGNNCGKVAFTLKPGDQLGRSVFLCLNLGVVYNVSARGAKSFQITVEGVTVNTI